MTEGDQIKAIEADIREVLSLTYNVDRLTKGQIRRALSKVLERSFYRQNQKLLKVEVINDTS